MKKLATIICLTFFGALFCAGQNIAPAPTDKAVVYFVRPSILGLAAKFTYFDSTRLIGKFSGLKYIRYECEPGTHLFWARSENRDFIEAKIEAGKIYFIEAIVKMGAVKAAVELLPIDPKDSERMNRILKLMSLIPSESFSTEELAIETSNLQGAISRGLDKYRLDKQMGKTNAQLEQSMFYIIPPARISENNNNNSNNSNNSNNNVQSQSISNDSSSAKKIVKKSKSSHYFDFGLTISYFNKAKAPSNDPSTSQIFKRDVRTSISFGYHFQRQFTPSLFLVTGIYYAERGSSYKYENKSVVVTYTNISGKTTSTENGKDYLNYRLSYVELPVSLGIKLDHDPNRHILFVAGINPMFNVVSKLRASYYDGPSNDLKQKWDQIDFDIARKALVALNAGFQIGTDHGYLSVMYNGPLTNVYNTEHGYEKFNVIMRSFTFSLGIGLNKLLDSHAH